MPPRRGPAVLNSILNGVYDLQTGTTAPDFSTAATRLMVRQRRRALIVLISNVRDDDGEELASAIRLMRRRHLVLLASLRETVLDEIAEEPVGGFDEALRYGAVQHYLASRQKAYETLRGRGVLSLDVTPPALPIAVVNRYLDAKRDGTL